MLGYDNAGRLYRTSPIAHPLEDTMTPTSIDVAQTWTRIEQVLQKHVPDTARTLAGPATDEDIAELQAAIGLILPTDFCQSLKVHNVARRCSSFILLACSRPSSRE
jgi:cell wall assembly regulator SMI1